LQRITGRRTWSASAPDNTGTVLVERIFAREGLDQLWVTDITEHPNREGKVYCCVVLDTFSRRVVGWAIDASPYATLVTNALGMAIDGRLGRSAEPGTIIQDRKSTRLNSSHVSISYAVFCLKKKKK